MQQAYLLFNDSIIQTIPGHSRLRSCQRINWILGEGSSFFSWESEELNFNCCSVIAYMTLDITFDVSEDEVI